MKKIISLLLVLAMVSCIFVGCGKDDDGGKDRDVVDNFEWPENLGERDYDGYEFRILTWGLQGGTHWSDQGLGYNAELQGDIVNDAVLTRDKTIEQKLNIKLVYNEQPKDAVSEYARTSIDAGSDDFDVVSASIVSAAGLAKEGKLLDLYDFKDTLNLDAEWWDQNANSQLSIQNHLYFTTSALTLVDKNATWVVYFTKNMIDKYNLCPDYENGLYSMVEEGEWTIDKMYEMVKAVSADTNGDGEMTDEDTYGHCGEQFNLGALMVGCGSRVAEKDETDTPIYVWTDQTQSLRDSYQLVYDIVTKQDYSMTSGRMGSYGYEDLWVDGFGSLMTNDRVLFNVTGMNRCYLYRNLDCEFGIVPVPKANKEQDSYHSLMSMGQANSIAIPQTCQDTERTCVILDALTCLAYQTTYNAYINKALTYKYLRDDDSAAMLDIIFDNRLYDVVDVYGWGQGTASFFGGAPNPDAVASAIKAVQMLTKVKMRDGLKEFLEVYENVGEANQ